MLRCSLRGRRGRVIRLHACNYNSPRNAQCVWLCVCGERLSQVLLRVCKSAMAKEEKVEKGKEELGHRCQSSWRLCSPLSYADCLCHVRQREKKKEGERERGKILAHLSWSNNKIMS